MAEEIKPTIKVLLKRGTREQNDRYIGEEGEITIVIEDSKTPIEEPVEPEEVK